jgi:YD repeat-containing protein
LQQRDAENRLTVVTNTTTLSVTRFVYDGDGARVLQIKPDGSQTAYVGGLMETDITATVPLTPAGWSGRITRQESGEGLSGVTLTLNKQEVCALGNGTLSASVSWYSTVTGASATLYVYDANANYIGGYAVTLSYSAYWQRWTGATNISLPPGSYQAYVEGSGTSGKAKVYQYSDVLAFAINGVQTTALTFDLLYPSLPVRIGPVPPLPYTSVTTTTIPLTSTVTTATGAYGLYVTGITYNGACTNSLWLVESVPLDYIAQAASAPTPGTVLSATVIQYPPVSGGQTYPSNNFTLSSNSIPTTGAIKKVYYSAGSQLIAMRIITDGGSVLYYLPVRGDDWNRHALADEG